MENKSKSTTLVAWTDKGRVLMVPYLLDEMREQYLEEIKHLDDTPVNDLPFFQDDEFPYWSGVETLWDAEIEHLLRKSSLWEAYGDFLLRAGRVWDAYDCFKMAALEPLCCRDSLWCDTETSQIPMTTLLYRFIAMYKRCRELVDQDPNLMLKFHGSWLENDYEEYAHWDEDNDDWKEIDEYFEVWNFGKDF